MSLALSTLSDRSCTNSSFIPTYFGIAAGVWNWPRYDVLSLETVDEIFPGRRQSKMSLPWVGCTTGICTDVAAAVEATDIVSS